MATTAQKEKLRRKIQDYYNKRDGTVLASSDNAFQDDELDDILDDAFIEVTDGERTSATGTAIDESMAMLLSRADAIIMIAQDEARRIRWQANNEIIDPTQIAPNLIAAARELRARYDNYRKRKQEKEVEGVENRPSGGIARFNSTTGIHSDRNFNNSSVRRNRSPHH